MKKFTLLFALLFVSLLSSAQERRSASATLPEGDLIAFPNPASSFVTINPGTTEVEFTHLRVYNLQGVLVEDRTISPAEGGIVIDLENYDDGIYVIALTDDNDYNRRSGRIVKRR
ncbi:MAG: T9SS type A sorting domain-containing protein [Fluviicola sp.]|nr:T9SS type A sorting domain-containing protein [Fluviicola sp.]